jgi:hypothetical protein
MRPCVGVLVTMLATCNAGEAWRARPCVLPGGQQLGEARDWGVDVQRDADACWCDDAWRPSLPLLSLLLFMVDVNVLQRVAVARAGVSTLWRCAVW